MSPQPQATSPAGTENLFVQQNQFTIANMAAMYTSSFGKGYSNDQRQAAIRAVLRHSAHSDGAHYYTKTKGGLHPAYALFNPAEELEQKALSRAELANASLGDLFDALTMQDRLDGGISLLIRCPGSEALSSLSADKVTVDLYITPRELRRNERISGDTAMLVQAFCQEFAVPHLQRFTERCKVESILPPNPRLLAEPISIKGPDHLPYPNPLVSRIQCVALATNTVKASAGDASEQVSPSAAIREATLLAPRANTPPPPTPVQPRSIRKRRLADAAFLDARENLPAQIPVIIPNDTPALGLGPALISLGPNTDAVLDRFHLGDQLLPRLHTLVRTMRSSRWEAVLCATPWNLSREQASYLTRALAADLGNAAVPSVTKKPTYSVVSSVFQLVGIMTLLFGVYVLYLTRYH